MLHVARFGLVLAVAALGAAALSGCYSASGPGWSGSAATYQSTTWSPKTVYLLDTRTGETVWSVEVPVGKQVVLQFEEGTGPNERNQDILTWDVMDSGERFGSLPNRRAVPPAHARRLEWEQRPAPEYVEFEPAAGGTG
jgi:hypothetical protein